MWVRIPSSVLEVCQLEEQLIIRNYSVLLKVTIVETVSLAVEQDRV
jgi:hypothetical protein